VGERAGTGAGGEAADGRNQECSVERSAGASGGTVRAMHAAADRAQPQAQEGDIWKSADPMEVMTGW